MIHVPRIAAAVCVAVFLTACVTLTDKAMRVQIHSQMSTLLDGCTKLGPVSGSGSRTVSLEHAHATAKVRVREAAADLGGDTVVLLNTDTFFTEVVIQGVALRCYK